MDELDVQGKKYISSKRGAELTGYAKDYIGQLARAGKVPGTRFGRAWFVEEAALLKHLGAEVPQTQEVVEVSTSTPASASVSATASTSPQAKKPLLSHHMIAPVGLPKTWSSVQYLHDDSELFPVVVPRMTEIPTVTRAIVEPKKSPIETPAPVPVHVTIPLSVEKRVQTLVDGIRPRSAVLRVAQNSGTSLPKPPARKKEEVKPMMPLRRSVAVHWSAGSFVNALAVFILVFGSFGTFLLTQTLSLGSTEHLTASSFYGLEDTLDVLKDARLFDAGLEAINSFYTFFVESFFVFLRTGADFVVDLF